MFSKFLMNTFENILKEEVNVWLENPNLIRMCSAGNRMQMESSDNKIWVNQVGLVLCFSWVCHSHIGLVSR